MKRPVDECIAVDQQEHASRLEMHLYHYTLYAQPSCYTSLS